MPYKNPLDKKRHDYKYYRKHKKRFLRYQRTFGLKYRQNLKVEVLTHYGKGRKLKCRWFGCGVVDVDMLSIDHVNNDGKHRQMGNNRSGWPLYSRLKREGYPEGFQTLCHNHQFKKELVRKRAATAQRDKDDSDVPPSSGTDPSSK